MATSYVDTFCMMQGAPLELDGVNSSRKSSSAAAVNNEKENMQMRGKIRNASQEQSADAAAAPRRPQMTRAGPETQERKPVLVPLNPRGSTAGSSLSVQAAPLGHRRQAHMDTPLQVSSDICRLCSCKMASYTMTALGFLFSLLACHLQKLGSCVMTHNWYSCLSVCANSQN